MGVKRADGLQSPSLALRALGLRPDDGLPIVIIVVPAVENGAGKLIDGYTRICDSYTLRLLMRTNIDIDDRLMRQAMRSSGARTKRAAVEEGLRLLIRTKEQGSIRRLRGKVAWEGDLNASRLARVAK